MVLKYIICQPSLHTPGQIDHISYIQSFLLKDQKRIEDIIKTHTVKQTQCDAQAVLKYKSKYKKVGVLPIQKVKSNVFEPFVMFLSDNHGLYETLDFAFYIGSTPTICICICIIKTMLLSLESSIYFHGGAMHRNTRIDSRQKSSFFVETCRFSVEYLHHFPVCPDVLTGHHTFVQ